MKLRFFNNTGLKDEHVMDEVKHWYKLIDSDKLESIEINKETINFYGIDCSLGEFKLHESLQVTGKIRWFDEASGYGVIRLSTGASIQFYSCNVNGANSMYPELTNNIQFEKQDAVMAEFSSDHFVLKTCGLINIKKAV